MILAPTGTKSVPTSPMEKNQISLTDKETIELVEITKEIEKIMGSPQDVEFAIDLKHTLYILQSRPIVINKNSKKTNIRDLEWNSPGPGAWIQDRTHFSNFSTKIFQV